MRYLTMERTPELQSPVAVLAFTGWNDAANAASNAARFVVRRLGARRFASMEAEPFYAFTETRPSVRLDSSGERQLTWPGNEFYYARTAGDSPDYVIGIGAEPNLRWRTFSQEFMELFDTLDVSMVVSLGALIGEASHRRPIGVTGSAANPELAAKLDLQRSRYEGPTGIVGILHYALQEASRPSASLWATVPHYITGEQCPPATLAVLQRLERLLGTSFDLAELETASDRFRDQLDTTIAGDPQMRSYLERLESALAEVEEEEAASDPLPEATDLVGDIEEFLRGNSEND
ncbi:MAG: PAC2 family protein [Dehalococcoidia bacterium]|nr:PAC2 family protein [Chloroflexota bacterium]MXY72435.1 PAC2 family protein [Dehalococcoidia bacterium]